MSEFTLYRKKLLQPMRPFTHDSDLKGVSVAACDEPEIGGMIAVNPEDETDKWYVSKQFFNDNYEVA